MFECRKALKSNQIVSAGYLKMSTVGIEYDLVWYLIVSIPDLCTLTYLGYDMFSPDTNRLFSIFYVKP